MHKPDDDVPKLTWRRLAVLPLGAVAIYLVMLAIGLTLTRADDLAELRSDEFGINHWFVDQRTPLWDSITDVTSSFADTMTVVALTAVMFVVLRLWLGRWRESVALALAVAGEVGIFMLLGLSIERQRPDVPKLDDAPPTSSFPSGHTAASVALYGTVAVLVLIRLTYRKLAATLAVLLFAVPVIVALSRLYRGMHFVGDVLFGLLFAAAWAAVVLLVLLRPSKGDRQTFANRARTT